jgi:hypothetical protein
MIKTDFMKIYEELEQLQESLHEQWYTSEEFEGYRIWFSESEYTFRNFLRNLPSTGMKGVRLVVAPSFYLATNAEDLDHQMSLEVAEEELGFKPSGETDQATLGIPKCVDFELGNFEIAELAQAAIEYPDDEEYADYLDYDAEKDYAGMLVADCGSFEITLYTFKSKTYPEFKPQIKNPTYFEDSELYRVLKPLIKRLYIYGKD